MKILKVFLFVVTFATLSSCSSDDDNNVILPVVIELSNATVAGTYDIVFYQSSSQTSVTASDGSTVVTETELISGDTFTNAAVTFTVGGGYTLSGSYVQNSILTVSGQPPMSSEEIVILDETGSYSINSLDRTLNLGGDVLDVLLFDLTSLNLSGSDTETDQGETETRNYEIRLVRQN